MLSNIPTPVFLLSPSGGRANCLLTNPTGYFLYYLLCYLNPPFGGEE
jgi:hypothetical protein